MTNIEVYKKRRDELIKSGEMTKSAWYAMDQAFPGSRPESKVMVWDYCMARKLDPLKKMVHIVPIFDSKLKKYVDVVITGIAEARATAFRTKQYAGMSNFRYGETINVFGLDVPEYCEVTIYRMIGGVKCEFPGRAEFIELCGTRRDKKTGEIRLNRTWSEKPKTMIRKCAEADGLRRAFPEELGGEPTMEEMSNGIQGDVCVTVNEPDSGAESVGQVFEAAVNGDLVDAEVVPEPEEETAVDEISSAEEKDKDQSLDDAVDSFLEDYEKVEEYERNQ